MKIIVKNNIWLFFLLIVQLSCNHYSLDSEVYKNNRSATYLIFNKGGFKILNSSTPTLAIEFSETTSKNGNSVYHRNSKLWTSIPDTVEVKKKDNSLNIKPPLIDGKFIFFNPDFSWDSITLKRVSYGKIQHLQNRDDKSNNNLILADMILDSKAIFLDTLDSSLDGYFEYSLYHDGLIIGHKIAGTSFTYF